MFDRQRGQAGVNNILLQIITNYISVTDYKTTGKVVWQRGEGRLVPNKSQQLSYTSNAWQSVSSV